MLNTPSYRNETGMITGQSKHSPTNRFETDTSHMHSAATIGMKKLKSIGAPRYSAIDNT